MPRPTRALWWLLSAVCLLGCRDKGELEPTPVDIRYSPPRVSQMPEATVIELDLQFTNPTAEPQELFVFVTAHNNEPRPPSRAIWPETAEAELRNSFSGVVIALPERGHRVALAPGATSAASSVIVAAADRRVFKEYWVQAFDKTGQLVFDRRGELR